MKVAITGATGFVGSRLVARLHSEGHNTLVLTRNTVSARKVFPAEVFPRVEIIAYTPMASGSWQDVIAGCDGVVNLAGEPIAEERWTAAQKEKILNSRQIGTEKIVEAIAKANPQPPVLVSASAIGYYGTSETAIFDETSSPGSDFLAEVCQNWEAAAHTLDNTNVRLVILRLGIVLGDGGALGKMITPFKLFTGGIIGSGRQWLSWIHIDDLVNLIIYSLSNPQVKGVYNATAPYPANMSDFCNTLGQVMHRPSWLPVPGFALEVLLGDGAMLVLQGQRVLPQRTLDTGFQYQYPQLPSALKQIIG